MASAAKPVAGCCRCCGGAGALTCLALLIALALESGTEPLDAFRPGSAAAELPGIPRVQLSMGPDGFYQKHVLAGVPAIISLLPDVAGGAKLKTLREELLSAPCADARLRMMSTQQEDVVMDLEHLDGWPRRLVDLGLVLLAGVDLRGWVQQRLISLRQLSEGSAAERARPPRLLVRLASLLARLTPMNKGFVAIAKLVSQPVYLADKPVDEVCSEVLRELDRGDVYTQYEHYTMQKVKDMQRVWARRNFTDLEATSVGLLQTPELRLFWGGGGSYTYPLHRDVVDADILCTLYSGCKDVVVLKPSARHFLRRIEVPGFEYLRQFTWVHDYFVDPPVEGVQGWSGIVRAGELLYVPGEMFHHIRNRCVQSLSLCRRPWRASEVRDVMPESLKSLNLMLEGESLDSALQRLFRHEARRRRPGEEIFFDKATFKPT